MNMKKVLAMLLAVIMVLVTLIVPGFAAEGEPETVEASEVVVAEEQALIEPAAGNIASVNGVAYPTLQEAVDAAKNGQTVTLLDNVDLTACVVVKQKNIILDLAEHTVSNSVDIWKDSPAVWSLIRVDMGGNLTITGNGTLKAKANDCYAIDLYGIDSKCTIESGTFIGNICAVYIYRGTLTIKGGTYSIQQTRTNDPSTPYGEVINCRDNYFNSKMAEVKFQGGRFQQYDPATGISEPGSPNLLTKDYASVPMNVSGETYYEVIPAVAAIGNKGYATLAEAVAAAESGDTVKLMKDAGGNGIVIDKVDNLTIDFGGHTYTVDGAMVGSEGTETNGFQLLSKGAPDYAAPNLTFKNGTVQSAKTAILIQNYSNLTLENMNLIGQNHTVQYALSNNNGNTLLTGKTNITVVGDRYAFDVCKFSVYPSATVTLDGNFTGEINGKISIDTGAASADTHKLVIAGGRVNGKIEETGVIQEDVVSITGGVFAFDVNKYVAGGYYQTENPDGTFTVQKSAAEVVDTAKTTGAEIKLENLERNGAVNPTEDATYQVVVATAPAADAAAANAAIEANTADTNADKAIFDISVQKTDSTGAKTDVSNTVVNQKVSITLAEPPAEGTQVYVYHVNDQGSAEKINDVAVTGNVVTFTAPSFSTYAITYTAKAAAEGDVTGKIGVVFSPVSEGGNQYNITLKSLENGKKINRFMTADLVFKNEGTGVTYEILPAANVNVSAAAVNGNSTEYHFELNGTAASSVSGDAITIGTVEFGGYGSLNFSIDEVFASGHAVNIVNTAKVSDSIVSDYTVEGNTLVVNEAVSGQPNVEAGESGVITGELKPAQQTLTVNVAFPNGVTDNAAAYQDMKATVSGGDLTENIVLNFGSDGVAQKDGGYSFTQELTQNVSYTVTLEGAGYRTVRYTVNMNSDKTLNFWNNVKDEATVVEVGKDASAVKSTFLAGDIVKDNIINLYDLSAVVSYFGTENLVADYPAYAKYDLNRDGKIDSKDVAMVLVSWGN